MTTNTTFISKLGKEIEWPINSFWQGNFAGSLLIAGGKVWTLLTDPNMKVSTLMGHIGTPAFRRELSVFLLVNALTYQLFDYIGKKNGYSHDTFKGKIYSIVTGTISLAVASLVAASVTTATYHPYFFYPTCVATVVFAGIKLYEQRDRIAVALGVAEATEGAGEATEDSSESSY